MAKMKKPKTEVTFKIDKLPVTENSAVRMTARGGYKTKLFRQWERAVVEQLEDKIIAISPEYGVEIIFSYPLKFKNGNLKHKDAHNMIKYAIDTILAHKLLDSKNNRIDDSVISEGSWARLDSDKDGLEITFYTIGR
jgi:hypothetical protein